MKTVMDKVDIFKEQNKTISLKFKQKYNIIIIYNIIRTPIIYSIDKLNNQLTQIRHKPYNIMCIPSITTWLLFSRLINALVYALTDDVMILFNLLISLCIN